MPLYEYKCLGCGAIIEALRQIKSRDDIGNCGSCGAAMELIISRFNIVGPVASQKTGETLNTDLSCKARGTAVRMERGSSALFNYCGIRNYQTGFSVAKGSELSIVACKFENVVKPIEVTDEPKKP